MAKKPPVPSENRSPKAPPTDADEGHTGRDDIRHETEPENTAQQGRHGNIKQNTTNQGYQQDR